jgi:hypothetical protein
MKKLILLTLIGILAGCDGSLGFTDCELTFNDNSGAVDQNCRIYSETVTCMHAQYQDVKKLSCKGVR